MYSIKDKKLMRALIFVKIVVMILMNYARRTMENVTALRILVNRAVHLANSKNTTGRTRITWKCT